MKRPPSVHEFKPAHTEGHLLGPEPAELGLVRYKRIWQILISGLIVGVVAFILMGAFLKARGPARLTDCMGRQRVLSQSLEMYRQDNDARLPPGPVWRWAVSDYVDMVGGATEGVEDMGRVVRPRSFSSPMRCLANQTTIPISYLYLDPTELQARYPDVADQSDLPVLVDETHHRSVVVLGADGSSHVVPRTEWVEDRANAYHIARRPDWQDTFAYYVPAPQ